jgi:Fe-S cluster assembly ATPase SufC
VTAPQLAGLLPELEVIRKDFPILGRTLAGGVPLVYLDSANTSQKPQVVIDTMVDHLERHNANVARAMHQLGAESSEAFEAARDKVAAFINAPSRDEVIFTKNASEALNLVASRNVNEGFSGGEKKRHEIAQLELLNPLVAVLDETDSGLDIDALKTVAQGVRELVGEDTGALVITHYQRILNYVKPDFVHVFVDGRIVEEGGPELAHKLEAEGYEGFGANGRNKGSDS